MQRAHNSFFRAHNSMYHYRWRLLPGLYVQSRFHWSWPAIAIAVLVCVVMIYLASHAPTAERSALFQQPAAAATAHGRPLPRPQQRHAAPRGPIAPQQRRQSGAEAARPIKAKFVPTKQRRPRLTRRQRENVLARFQHRCAWCQRDLSAAPWLVQLDHMTPLAVDPGGRHTEQLNDPLGFNWQPIKKDKQAYTPTAQHARGGGSR